MGFKHTMGCGNSNMANHRRNSSHSSNSSGSAIRISSVRESAGSFESASSAQTEGGEIIRISSARESAASAQTEDGEVTPRNTFSKCCNGNEKVVAPKYLPGKLPEKSRAWLKKVRARLGRKH